MALPTRQQWFESVYRIKQDCLKQMAVAQASGNKKLIRESEKSIIKVDKLIIKAGGRP